MALAHLDDVSYGHLGDGYYDSTSKRWVFRRKADWIRSFQKLSGSFKVIVPPAQGGFSDGTAWPHGSKKDTDRLLLKYPELVPAALLLPELAAASESVTRHTSAYEPLASTLIAFGKAASRSSKKRAYHDIDVVAFVGGQVGEVIHVAPVREEVLGVQDTSLFAQEIRAPESTLWCDHRTPVQQLCFSKAGAQEGTHFALRSFHGTTLLRPYYHRPRSRQGSDRLYGFRKHDRPIEIRHVVTIDVKHTDGAHHACVDFNPWDEHQVVIMTADGRWAVWSVEGCCTKDVESVQPILFAKGTHDSLPVPTAISPDGWGMALWLSGPAYIMTATRKSITLFSMQKPEEPLLSRTPDTESDQSWILDVKRKESDFNLIVVLSSKRISLLRLHSEGESDDAATTALSAEIIFSTLHHQDAGDPSLALNLAEAYDRSQEDDESEGSEYQSKLLLFIGAKSSNCLTGLFLEPNESRTYCLASDLFSADFSLPSSYSGHTFGVAVSRHNPVLSLHVSGLRWSKSDNGHPKPPAAHPSELTSAAFQVLALHSDFSLTSRAFGDFSRWRPTQVKAEAREQKPAVIESVNNADLGDFIVPDIDTGHRDLAFNNLAISTLVGAAPNVLKDTSQYPKTLELGWLAETIQRHEKDGLQEQACPRVWKKIVEKDVEGFDMARLLPTLFEHLAASSDEGNDDRRKALGALWTAVTSPKQEAGVLQEGFEQAQLLQLWSPLRSDAPESEMDCVDLLVHLRRYLTSHWLPPAMDLPEPARMYLESTLNQVAVQLATSSQVLFKPSGPARQPPRGDEQLQEAEFSSPPSMAGEQGFNSGLRSSQFSDLPSVGLSTPDPSDMETSQSQTPQTHGLTRPRKPRLSTLEQYTTFKQPEDKGDDIVNHMLDQWAVWEDPQQYQWLKFTEAEANMLRMLSLRPKSKARKTRAPIIQPDAVVRAIQNEKMRSSGTRKSAHMSQSSQLPVVLQSSQAMADQPPAVKSSQVIGESSQSRSKPGFAVSSSQRTPKKRFKEGFG